MSIDHSLDLDTDEDGWWFAACACGWISPPCPEASIAGEFYGDHCAAPYTESEEPVDG